MDGLFPKKGHSQAVKEKRGRTKEYDAYNGGASKKVSKTVEVAQKPKIHKPVVDANAGTLFAIRRDKNKDFCQLMDQAGASTDSCCHGLLQL